MFIIFILLVRFYPHVLETSLLELNGFELFIGLIRLPLFAGVLFELYYTWCWFYRKYIKNKPCKKYTTKMRSFMSVDRLLEESGMNQVGCFIASLLLHVIFPIFTIVSIPIDVIYFMFHVKDDAEEEFYRPLFKEL